MKINRKYAIRKLAVGVASVSIGLFIANSVDTDSFNVVKAVDSGYNRTESGQVDPSGGIRTLKPSEEVKAVQNGEKNFYSTVAFTTEAGLGSGTLINEDTIVTVAHNFVHLNTKNNPITVENNVKKSGDIHIATLPNGKQVKFSNDDVKYWNREGYVQGFKNDLAVIKLKNKFTGETGATLHNEVTKLSNGDRIHVFGFPKGKLIPILNGTVENVENYGANIMGVAYQGSAPGMSGGGLYNANGELIGVNQNGVEGIRSGGITFSKEQLDWIKSIARGENANPVYLADEPKTDDKDKEEVHPKHGRLLYTEETTTPEKTEVVNNIIKVGTKPKVEYIGRGKDIIRKTTTYTVNSETGVVSENVKEEVNPEVDMHFYFVYSIKDESDPSLNNEYGNSKGKIIKEVEYIPEKGKWLANDTLHSFSDGNPDNDIVGAVKWPNDEKFEYNNDIYKVVGSSVEHILSGPDSNDTERSNYERDLKIWHRYPDSRLFYQLDTPVGNSVFNEDYKKLNDAGLVKDGTIVKAFLYAEPVRGTYTQTFIDEDQAKAHENDENYNPEDYSIKEKYFSGYHKLTEDLVIPKVPQYIQKDNKIYKLSSHSEEPTTKKYIDAELFTDYKYKVVHDNTTKEDITRVAPKDVYVADESRDRTSENIKTNGTEGITRTVTTYKVDNDGNLTEEVSTPEKTEVVNNVIKVGTKPKVEYFIRDDVAMKKTTTYTVNSETGEVTEKVQETTIGRAKDKVKTTPIPSPKVYQKDSDRELNMPNEVIQGEEGSSSVNITYTLNKETGELTENQSEPVVKNPTPTIIKVAAKDKVVYSKKGNDIIKTTTTYNVNENNGEITSNSKEEVFKVDGLKDKVVVEDIEIPTVYLKDGNREKGKPNLIIEGELGKKTTTTTYNVNPKTGDVFEEKISTDIKHPKDKRIYVSAKDKIEVETIPYTTTYEKDANRELGKANLIYEGTEGSKTTVVKYKVNEKTGEITEERGRTLIREPQGKRILVPAKDKVEVVNKKDGKIIKKTTVYNVGSNTGKITEDIKEEVIADKGDAATEENLTELKVDLQKDTDGNILNVIKMGETPKDLVGYINTGKTELTKEGYKVYIYQKVESSKGTENPPVVENKDFVGGVNPDNAPVVEELPELKVAVIKDNEDNILDVIKAEEKPKDIPGYKNTGKTGIDKDGYKTYIYEKVKEDKQSVVEDKKEANLKENNNKEIAKKEELPSTTAIPMLSSVSLLSVLGVRKRKDKK